MKLIYRFIATIILLGNLSLVADEYLELTKNQNTYTAFSKVKGLIEAYPRALGSEMIPAELSAAVFNGSHIILFNDKKVRNKKYSPVFAIDYQIFNQLIQKNNSFAYISSAKIQYSHGLILKQGIKYESASLTKDGQHVLAAASFTSTNDSTAKGTRYGSFFVWENDNENSARLAHPSLTENILSSETLRKAISKILDVPYFDMEGLAVINNDTILLGIRQVGEHYANCKDVIYILKANFNIDPLGELTISNIIPLYDFSELDADEEINIDLGLSSLGYDEATKRLYMLTSYELNGGKSADDIGSYLWVLEINAETISNTSSLNTYPTLVRTQSGAPLYFESKMEALAILPNNHLLIVADDDAVQNVGGLCRRLNEANFEIVKIIK